MPEPTNPEFSLLDEPWIPVLDSEGQIREVALKAIFDEAPHLLRIAGDLPTQSLSLLRLLLAILHRALVPATPEGAASVRDTVEQLGAAWGTDVVPAIQVYLEQHRERFELFHPTLPFFQTAGLRTTKGDVSELAKIVADVPNGTPFLTMRSERDLKRISAAEGARWLVHAQSYDPSGIKTGVVGHPRAKGGKVYPEGTAWTGQIGGFRLEGATLRDTLLLNLWAALPKPADLTHDLPPWERGAQTLEPASDLGHRPAGPVDLYTWQPRRILLVRAQGSTDVIGVTLTYGDRLIQQEHPELIGLEPMTAWRFSKPQTAKYRRDVHMAARQEPGAILWRGMSTLVRPRQGSGAGDSLRAGVIEHGVRFMGSPLLPKGIVRLATTSVKYGSNESVVDEVTEDSLDLPSLVLEPEQHELRAIAVDAVASAVAGVDAVRSLAANLAIAGGGSGDALSGPRDRARERAYSALDPAFRTWLVGLPGHADDPGVAVALWHHLARRELVQLAETMITEVPDRAWRAWGANGGRVDVGKADVWFRAALAKAFPKAHDGRQIEAMLQSDSTAEGVA